MKKILYMMLAALLLFGLSACEDQETTQALQDAVVALDAAKDQIATLNDLNTQLQGQVNTLIETIENDTTQEDYQQALLDIQQLNNDITNLNSLIAVKQLEYNTLLLERNALATTSEQVQALYDTLTADYAELNTEYNTLVYQFTLLQGLYDMQAPLTFMHINGEGVEVEYDCRILFEYEVLNYVIYQITYLSNTSGPALTHFWQVAYVEINKTTNDINFISFDEDSSGIQTPGTWADFDGTLDMNFVSYNDIKTDFIPWLVGKTSQDLAGISVFTNETYYGIDNTDIIYETNLIDEFAGASVSTNNMIRVMKVLLAYHEEHYSS